jgi:hypothetical protein
LYIGHNPDILWYACRNSEEYNRLQYCKSIHYSGYRTAAAIDEFLIKCHTNGVLNLGYREVAYDYLARAMETDEIVREWHKSTSISVIPSSLRENIFNGIKNAIKSFVDHCKGQSISYVFEHRFDFVDREEGEQAGESIVAKTIQQLGEILPSFLKSDSDGPVKCSRPEELAARASHDYKAFETSLFANDASSIPLVGSPDLNSCYDDCST